MLTAMRHSPWLVPLLLMAACGGDPSNPPTPDAPVDPTQVPFGTTAIVVVVNPIVNDSNSRAVPLPGTVRAGVTLTTDDNVTATTDATGIAVLAPVTAGIRTITVTGAGVGGTFTEMVAANTLREVALATEGTRAEVMLDVDYKSDLVMEVTPAMTTAQVNDILKVSDRVVFFQGGSYQGDLDFSGSRVTLFGEGVLGGRVTFMGNMTISGSDSRIRGTHITGNLTIPASGVGLSFSRVDGITMSEGSDAKLLANALCGVDAVTGSGSIVLGNAGVSPITTCP
jgi:hypothetical protein